MEENRYYNFINLLDFMSKNIKNFYFYINLLYFLHYVNNFPKLKCEKINRLKFYFFNLFKQISAINYDKIHLNDKNDNMSDLFLKELLKISSFQDKNDNILPFILSLIIGLQSYREICNLIPKQNIFTKSIENKILYLIKNIRFALRKIIASYTYGSGLDMIDIYNIAEKSLKNDYFRELKIRQKNRMLFKNFNKYFVDNFSNIGNNNQIIEMYNDILLNKNIYVYKKSFVINLIEFLERL